MIILKSLQGSKERKEVGGGGQWGGRRSEVLCITSQAKIIAFCWDVQGVRISAYGVSGMHIHAHIRTYSTHTLLTYTCMYTLAHTLESQKWNVTLLWSQNSCWFEFRYTHKAPSGVHTQVQVHTYVCVCDLNDYIQTLQHQNTYVIV